MLPLPPELLLLPELLSLPELLLLGVAELGTLSEVSSPSASTMGSAKDNSVKRLAEKVRHDAKIIAKQAKIGKVLCLLLYVISVINIT